MLEDLLVDPGFLLAAELTRLVRLLPIAATTAGREAERVVQQAAPYLLAAPADDRALYLEMAARRNETDWLADRLSDLNPQRPWRIAWTRWRSASPHRLLGAHTGRIWGLAITELDGRLIVVSGGGDGLIRRWDVRTGAPVGPALMIGEAWSCLTLGRLEGRPIVVSATVAGERWVLQMWDLRDGAQIREPLPVADRPHALQYLEINREPLIASGGNDGVLRVYNLSSGALERECAPDERMPIWYVAVGEVDGRTTALCASGWENRVHAWDVATGGAVGKPIVAGNPVIGPTIKGRATVVANHCYSVWAWDLLTGEVVAKSPEDFEWPIRPLAAIRFDGRTIAVSGSTGGAVRVWDLDRMRPIGAPMLGHDGVIIQVSAVKAEDGQLLAVSGGRDGTVRLWEMDSDAPAAHLPDDQQIDVNELGVGDLGGVSIVVTGGRTGVVHTYCAENGSLLAKSTIEGATKGYAWLDERPVAVTVSNKEPGHDDRNNGGPGGDTDPIVRVHDLLSGEPIGEVPVIETPSGSLSVLQTDDRLLVVGAGADGRVRVWNRDAPCVATGPHSVSQSRLRSIAPAQLGDQLLVVVADLEGAVWLLDLVTGEFCALPPSGRDPKNLFIKRLASRPVIVAGGTGPVHVWDLATQVPVVEPLARQGWPVYAIDVGTLRGCDVLVAGDGDGVLWVWDLDRRKVRTIETGAMILGLALIDETKIVLGGPLGVTMLRTTDTFWAEARPAA